MVNWDDLVLKWCLWVTCYAGCDLGVTWYACGGTTVLVFDSLATAEHSLYRQDFAGAMMQVPIHSWRVVNVFLCTLPL